MQKSIEVYSPYSFETENHFYPKALNAQIHPLVSFFFNLSPNRIIKRYIHLHPHASRTKLHEILAYRPKFFHWGGSDLFYVATAQSHRKMVIIETNSCPSGQKSMPSLTDHDEHRGYRQLIENSFLPALKGKRLPKGALGVLFDKNYMEASGYASTMADLTGESVYLIPLFDQQTKGNAYFKEGILYIQHKGEEIPLRAVFRYVTQRPWSRVPVQTKTFIYNPIIVCLAGGRNKLLASKAYELYNSTLEHTGLKILTPKTIRDVSLNEIPLWVERFGGKAVIKNPYSNAGQGVYTITGEKELDDFLETEQNYDQFIVQSLIGHPEWSSRTEQGLFYHIGTVPNKSSELFVADLRMMLFSTPEGMRPAAVYARKAQSPLKEKLEGQNSWAMLGTNLSKKVGPNQWESETRRLLLMDRKDFNLLGLGTDDLIEAYLQTLLSIIAIDQMAIKLINKKGQLRTELFNSLCKDPSLINEIKLQ